MGDGLRLRMAPVGGASGPYPTGRLQRGLLLSDGAADLAEEGVGFGVPVLKVGAHTVFPGGAEVRVREAGDAVVVEALFRLDLVERLTGPDGRPVRPQALYAVKDALAAVYRRLPRSRGLLTATSSGLRRRFSWVTTYVPVATVATVPVAACIDVRSGRVELHADLAGLPAAVTGAALMSEQGARAFDLYEEPGAALEGTAIGAWGRAAGPGARFVSRAHRVAFAMVAAEGGRVQRGRELAEGRLAWAGFGLTAGPPWRPLRCTLTVERLDR